VERESATEELIEAGGQSISLLEKRLPASSPESVARGVYVLSELALSVEDDTAQRSWSAIEKLAEQSQGALRRRAAESLVALQSLRKQRAREVLVSNGANVSERHGQLNGVIITMVYSIEIPEEFTGDFDDFRQIKWLDDVRTVTLRGEQITDEWLRPLADLKDVVALEVKHSRVTDAGLLHLKKIPNLQYLSVYYSPVSDKSIETIGSIGTLSEIRLFGTEVTAEGATQLQQALATANVDYRHGAFLGVGCQEHPDGAQVTIMHEGSAAEQAGMRAGDVIESFNDTKVANFEELKNAIAKHRSGKEVTLKVLRSGEPREFKVKLGQWE
jgi:hypothetical protein